MRIWVSSLIAVSCLFLLVACQSVGGTTATAQPPQATPTRISPQNGLGGIIGTVVNAHQVWPEEDLLVYAAEFYGDPQGNGFYLLEPNLFAHTQVDADGFFQLNDLTPGAYVLVVGPDPRSAHPISEQDRPMVVQVARDQVVELGSVSIFP
jgi:hypothetical protein